MNLEKLAAKVGEALNAHGRILVTAESCTGGMIAQVVTAVAGSSQWFDRGFVTYSNLSKQELLGVRPATLQNHGAVSAETVREMAEAALCRSHADIAVAVSGIAGPGGGTEEKPVGTVWFAWAGRWFEPVSERHQFSGDRTKIRCSVVEKALEGVLVRLE